MSAEIIKTYFHPTYPFEIVIVEMNCDGKPIRKQVLMDDILNKLVSYPARPISDNKIFAKAKEIALAKI